MKKLENPSRSEDENQGERPSLKERARQIRRAAYERAKAQRASDPKYLAMKEAGKQQRRAQYQQIKEQRKAAAKAEKTQEKRARGEQRAQERAAVDQELMKLLRVAAPGSKMQN